MAGLRGSGQGGRKGPSNKRTPERAKSRPRGALKTAAKKAPKRSSASGARDAAPDDGISAPTAQLGDKLYYRIGEVAKITGVKPYVLRYWESEFRWMAPQKSRSKQRLYRKRDIDMILLIKKLLYEQRFTIAGARKKLRDMGVGNALESGDLVFEGDHRARFQKIREGLVSIRAML